MMTTSTTMMSTSDRRAELEAAIDANMFDRSTYAVYADELQRLGDPRGELIALQMAPETPETVERANRLIAEHGLAPPIRLSWKWGFVASVRLDPQPTTSLDHPSLRFLRLVSIAAVETGAQPAIDALASQPRTALRGLNLGGGRLGATACDLGVLDGLWSQLPNLEHLSLEGQNGSLGVLHLPKLTSLRIASIALRDEPLSIVLDQEWTALRMLGLSFGHATPSPALLARLFAHPFPELRRLDLAGNFLDDLIEPIVRWPGLPRLHHLRLSGGLTDRGAASIAHHAKAFRRLPELDVSDNYLSPGTAGRLAEVVPEIKLGEQRAVDDRDLDLYDY